MARFLTLDDLSVAGKTVLVRADLNVPMRNGKVSDATRITRFAPTAKELADKGAKVVILSHFGRPDGAPDEAYSLKQLIPALNEALGCTVKFAELDAAATVIGHAAIGDVILLENTRFHPGETANDADLAERFAHLGEIYVNDAFSCAHRAHASTEGITHYLPSAAGRLMQAELEALQAALEKPTRPVMALVGGAKVSTKLEVLENLIEKVDALALGGGMANTFLKAKGGALGGSLVEDSMLDAATRIMERAAATGCDVILPTDGVAAADLDGKAETHVVDAMAIPADLKLLDIGPKATARLVGRIGKMKTVLWNGPLGVFEVPPFDAATVAAAKAVAQATRQGEMTSVGGGGDTLSALAHAGVADDFTYLSSAGGAFLEWLEGKTLPGVAALEAAAQSMVE